jgi:hypothetical protein
MMMDIERLFTGYPYRLKAREKQGLLARVLWKLTLEHKKHCPPYKRILETLPISLSPTDNIEDIPILPVRIFKTREFSSVPRSSVIRVLTSSGTTSQVPSHIFVNKKTIELEIKAFSAVIRSVMGKNKPFPVVLVDTANSLRDETTLGIRSYTLRGWQNLSSDCLFLLDDSMNIKWDELNIFLKKYKDEKIVLFGLTFIIWQHLYKTLVKKGRRLDLAGSLLFHTGGWKKLEGISKDDQLFKQKLTERLGLKRIYNFYGMTELIGVIFLECEQGYLHTPDFAEVIIRDPASLKPLPKNHKGLIQVFSPLAQSFPGHSILTEDLGEILGEDDCHCGRRGKYFRVHDRMPWAEIRGCSNTYAEDFPSDDEQRRE